MYGYNSKKLETLVTVCPEEDFVFVMLKVESSLNINPIFKIRCFKPAFMKDFAFKKI